MHEPVYSIHKPAEHETGPQWARQLASTIGTGLLAYAASYTSSILVARVLGPRLFGDYSATISSLTLLTVTVLFGWDGGLSQFIPGYVKQRDYAGVRGYIALSIKRLRNINIFIFVAGIVAMVALYALTNEHILDIRHTHPFYFYCWGVPLLVALSYISKYIRAAGYAHFYLIITSAGIPIVVLAAIAGFITFIRKFTLAEALLIYFSASIIVSSIGVFYCYKKGELRLIRSQAPRFETKTWIGATRALFFLAMALGYQTNILMIATSALDHDKKGAGLIAASISIVGVMWIIGGAVRALMAPKITVAVVEKNRKQIRDLVFRSTATLAGSCGIVLLTILFFGRGWLGHFGEEFRSGYPILVALASAWYLGALCGPATWAVTRSTKLKEFTYFSTALFVVSTVAICFATSFLGSGGAIAVYAVVQVIMTAYSLSLLVQILRETPAEGA